MKKRTLASLLAFVLLFALLSGSVFADGEAATYTTGETNGLVSFSLSVTPSKAPEKSEITTDPLMVAVGSKQYTYSAGTGGRGKDYEYTIYVPADTEQVTISYNLDNKVYSGTEQAGFFVEKADNDPLSPTNFTRTGVPESGTVMQTVVTLDENGGLSPRIIPYIHTNTKNQYAIGFNAGIAAGGQLYMAVYRFRFVKEQGLASITTDLEDRVVYNKDATVTPLQISVEKPQDSTIQYTWYRGTTPEAVNEQVSTDSTYTPDVSSAGVTYYRVIATVTTAEGKEVPLTSRTTKFVVKDPNVSFGLSNIWGEELITKSTSPKIYQTESAPMVLDRIQGKLSGTIPDNATITRIWSGSGVNQYDLTKLGDDYIDEDTNTFTIDLSTLVSEADAKYFRMSSDYRPQHHRRGCSLYVECSDGSVCTLILDSSYVQTNPENPPVLVQLVAADGNALPDFQVSNLRSLWTTSSVYTGTIQSDTPVVLRAQTYDDRATLVGGLIRDTVSDVSYWTEARSTWVLVNGEMIGGKSYGGTSNAPAESSAFTLKPGWNVVEVYTNARPYYFSTIRGSSDGLSNSKTIRIDGKNYTYEPALETDCVVYLIDYQGQSAQNVPQDDKTDTSLADITAIRYGDKSQTFAECACVWKDGTYEITVPTAFKTDKPDAYYYTHMLLLNAKPKTPGATAVISSNTNGLILGESISNSAVMDIEALKDKEDTSFTITVTAADGVTKKEYPAKILFASSATEPEITVEGPTLDAEFAEDTYTYYLNYASKAAGKMSITLPDGAAATVNDKSVTSGETITIDPNEDFYRLTITAADNFTTTSYYFVTKYADGTTPYATISENSKKLAKEMLSGWYSSMSNMKYAASYWQVFMAEATGNEDGTPFNFNGVYVEDPARHGMKQATDWAACIMEIVMLGHNPYDFPRYENGVLNEHCNYVEGLIKTGGGAWGNNVWYHMAAKAAGAPQTMLYTMKQDAMNPTFNLDIRGWTIASLSGCVETKDMVRYIDGLHNVQDTDGKYISLWTDNSWHGGNSGNTFTIGCVLSGIAAGGADPDKQFALDGHTPLETIKQTLYREDGKFYSPYVPDGIMPKDMIIGLGDILHGSNVWARYALTEQKYNDLIAKAKALNVDTSAMPATFTQTTACGKAYYDLYDAVYKALVAAGRTTEAKEMRPDVIWGMPYEVFADEVNKMPAASKLTANDLAKLKELIAQYEAMDDSSRKAVASDVLSRYQALVKRGLALKAEGTTADSDKISKIYDEILALPAASEITESNVEATLAKVTEIEQKIDQLSEEEKSLLAWMGNSVTKKLEDIRKAAPKQDITVSFTLYGDTLHEITTDDDIHTYFFDGTSLDAWIKTTNVTVPEGSTVLTVFEKVLGEKGFEYVNRTDNSYISSITNDANVTLAEKNNTLYSGWMYLVNDEYANVGLNAKQVKNGDRIVWHFTDDYRLEHSGMAYTPERVIEYVANLYDVSTPDKANAAYSKISTEYQTQVSELRANRKSVRDVIALIDAITDWNVQKDVANDRSTVTKWVQDKLNKELEGKLDGVTLDVAIGIYRITPATDEADGKYTVEITVSKGSGSLGATSKLKKAGVIKAPSADPAEGNKTAVEAAKAMLEKASFIYASKDVNTEAAAKAAVERQIGALLGDTDISYEVTMTGFTAAVDGTLWSEPTNGSFSFTVKLTKGENGSYAEANVNLTGTITAASKPVTPPTPSKPTKPSTKPTDEPAKPDASKFVDVSKNNWYFDAVQYVLENGLMNGTSANEFSPNANTTRGMIVTILARLDGVDTSGSSPWYAAGRTWAMNAGVSDGTNMDGKITREQLAAMLYRYAKLKGYDVSASADISGYTDASSVSSWATDAMRWAVGAGLINGRTATMLAPQGNATRAEVAAILMRVEQKLAK